MGVSSIIIITSQCIQKQLLTSSKWTLDRYVKSAAVLLKTSAKCVYVFIYFEHDKNFFNGGASIK